MNQFVFPTNVIIGYVENNNFLRMHLAKALPDVGEAITKVLCLLNGAQSC